MSEAADKTLLRLSVLGSLALVAGMLWPTLYGGVHTMHDIGEYYLPTRYFYAECLANGDAFDWFPNAYLGYYLQGDGQVGMYHPVHWLLYRFLPLEVGIGLEMSLGFPVMLLGVFALLRRWQLPRGVALFAGLMVGYSGYYMRHYEHMNAIQVLAHVPWLLLLIDIALRAETVRARRLGALGVAALTTSELLIGYPQYFWFSSFTEACYVACLLRTQPGMRSLVWLGFCKGIGVAGGAVQLLPTADLLMTSVREHMSIAERMDWPWHPFEAINLIAPYTFQPKILTSLYPGVVSVALISWLVLRRGLSAPRGALLATTAIGGLTAVLALGAYGLLFRYHLEIPVIGVFRMPYRYLSITSLAIGVLTALALHELVKTAGRENTTRRFPVLLLLPIAGAAAAAGVAYLDSTDRVWYVERHGGDYTLVAGGLALLTMAVLAVHRAERGSRSAFALLVLLACVDLGAFGYQWVYRAGVPVTLDEFIDAVPTPPDNDGRIVAALQNQCVFHDMRIDGGYMPMLPDAPFLQEIDEFGERRLPYLRLAGVHWVQDEDLGNLWEQQAWSIEALRQQNREWTAVPDPMPRARLVTYAAAREDPVAAGGQFAIQKVAAVDDPIELDHGEPGTAEIVSDRPGAIRVRVDVPDKQLLIVSERHRRGWWSVVDGRESSALRVFGTFLGAVVDENTEEVEFRFAPRSLVWGRYASLGALGVLVLLTLGVAARRSVTTRTT